MDSRGFVATVVLACLVLMGVSPALAVRGPVAAAAPTVVAPQAASAVEPSALVSGSWTYLGAQPPGRDAPNLVYDSRQGLFVLFGGNTGGSTTTNLTMTYSDTTHLWTGVTPTYGPSPREAAAMVYDSRSDRVVLFGGIDSSFNVLNDTWIFDLANDTWTNVTTVARPPARGGGGMVYDPVDDKAILFGGFTGLAVAADTWAYDYGTNSWSLRSPSGSPSARYLQTMAYSPISHGTILFGGEGVSGFSVIFLDDMYTYDYAGNDWTPLMPPVMPPQRAGASMAYDTVAQQMVLFGGSSSLSTSSYLGDTWAYGVVSNRWTQLTPALSPSARVDSAMAYDTAGDRNLLFGGTPANSGVNDEAWTFKFANPDTTPPAIGFTSPGNNSVIGTTNVTVNGTASDNVALAGVDVSLDGTNWTKATGTTTWTANLDLHTGKNTIYAQATDTSGNKATIWINVTVQLASTSGLSPTLEITIVIVIVAVAAVAAAAFVLMRRRRKPEAPESMPPQPPSPPPPPPGAPPGNP